MPLLQATLSRCDVIVEAIARTLVSTVCHWSVALDPPSGVALSEALVIVNFKQQLTAHVPVLVRARCRSWRGWRLADALPLLPCFAGGPF